MKLVKIIMTMCCWCLGPNGKLEWKRYKQYTKDDILAAIEEVKSGKLKQGGVSRLVVPNVLFDTNKR